MGGFSGFSSHSAKTQHKSEFPSQHEGICWIFQDFQTTANSLGMNAGSFSEWLSGWILPFEAELFTAYLQIPG